MTTRKLLGVERVVNVYKNREDPELIQEIDIDIPLEKLQSIVFPKNSDPLLYEGYMLDSRQLDQINKEIRNIIVPDFDSYYYVLECNGIYE